MLKDADLAAECGYVEPTRRGAKACGVYRNGHPDRRDTVVFHPWGGEARITRDGDIFKIVSCEDAIECDGDGNQSVVERTGEDLVSVLVQFLWFFI